MLQLDLADALGVAALPNYLARVEAELARAMTTDVVYLQKPLARLMNAGGKRLRPALVLATAHSQGAAIDFRVISAATAVELLHLATLVHDDIIDHAATRWNRPTVNQKEGLSAALVVGDFLLARAHEQAAAVSTEAVTLIAITTAQLCEGQARELADQHNLERTIESYQTAIRGKTASLFAAACRLGGLCAGASPSKLKVFTAYGEQFGLMFQLLDDILDFVADPKLTGKPTGADLAAGIYTLPVLLALATPDGPRLHKLLSQTPPDQQKITRLLQQTGALQKSLHQTQTYAKPIPKTPLTLQNFPQTYLAWSLQNFSNPALLG